MMAKIDASGIAAAIPATASCGGNMNTKGQWEIQERLKLAKPGDELTDIVPRGMISRLMAFERVNTLAEEREVAITGALVAEVYADPSHTFEMWQLANNPLTYRGSVAAEIPAEVLPIAHTALPVSADMVYENGPLTIKFVGLVPMGNLSGQLFAHLGVVFACECSREVVAELKARQLGDPLFRGLAAKVDTIDYGSAAPKLHRCTLAAKDVLGL